MRTRSDRKLRRIVTIAMFGAMAYAAMLMVHIRVTFLTLDLKDALITLCGLFFGPLSAVSLSVLVPFLEFITVSDTGIYGLVMNILGSLSFSVTTTLIYRNFKKLSGALLGLLTGVFAATGVMILANLIITPYYMGVTVSEVAALIPKLLLPFNLVKSVLNAGIVLLLYKNLSVALRRTGLLPRSVAETAGGEEGEGPVAETGGRNVLRTVVVTVMALLLIVASLIVIFAVLGGKFNFGVGA